MPLGPRRSRALEKGGFRLASRLEDGWHYGSGLFDALAGMKGTHGSATEGSSVGFVASNVDRLPGTLRAREVYPYLGLSREPEPPRIFVDPCSGQGLRP